MLALPTNGMARSVGEHNVQLDVLCDWIEGSVLFTYDTGEELGQATVVDTLCEAQIYARQEFAWERIADAWAELRRRAKATAGGYPFGLQQETVARVADWRDAPAYSFCLALCFAKWYPEWARGFGKNFNEQGELFELMTRHALEALFAAWEFHLTGWARARTTKIGTIVKTIAGRLGETVGNVERWTRPTANEAGLDLLCYRPFPDGRVGVPVYLVQCASGRDWEGKLHTPRLEIWRRIVDFAAVPRKAFATPFEFLDEEFIRNCGLVDGLLLDRSRLLSAGGANRDWLPADVAARMIAWTAPRIDALPRAAEVL